MAKSRRLVACTCNFKCKDTEYGFAMIPESTRRSHMSRSRRTCPDLQARLGCEPWRGRLGRVLCNCTICGPGGSMRDTRTYQRHQLLQRAADTLGGNFNNQSSNKDADGTNVTPGPSDEGVMEDFREVDLEPIIAGVFQDEVTAMQLVEEAWEPAVDVDEGEEKREVDGEQEAQHLDVEEEADPAGDPIPYDDALIEMVISLFCILDKHKSSQSLQDEILKFLFKGLRNDHELFKCSVEAQSYPTPVSAPRNWRKLSFARMLSLAGPNWKGGVGQSSAPSSWKILMETYCLNGLIKPERWRICTGTNDAPHHPAVKAPDDSLSECPQCGIPIGKTLAFDYIPFPKVLQFMFKSRTFTHDMLFLWRNKEDWKGKEPDDLPMNLIEFWHGSKFREIQAFWDPDQQWQLPLICPNEDCKRPYRAWPDKCDELNAAYYSDEDGYRFPCTNCSAEVSGTPQAVKGQPLNVALLGHWDGFQSATTAKRECWTVEIMILNAGKQELPDSILARPIPVLFIPMTSQALVRQKDMHLHACFLEPLYRDLEASFLHGIEIPKVGTDEKMTVRCILMSWSGDHPAQCKVGGFPQGGYQGCRRDSTHTELQNRRVCYSLNGLQARHPPTKRTAGDMYYWILKLGQSFTEQQRAEALKQGGIVFEADVWRLFRLYGFDPIRDLTVDAMHTIALNVLKVYNKDLVKDLDASGREILESTLRKLTANRPAGLGARWPKKPTIPIGKQDNGPKYKLSYYKAEEHQLFIMYCLPAILEHLQLSLDSYEGKIGSLLYHLTRLFYSISRKTGWTSEMIGNAREHCSAWRVITEEQRGANSAPLQHSFGNGELLDDVIRHGHHDNGWCYKFERFVTSYNAIKTNQKSTEMSYTQYYCRNVFSIGYKQLRLDTDGFNRSQRTIHFIEESLYPRKVGLQRSYGCSCINVENQKVCVVTSVDKAMDLVKLLNFLNEPTLKCVQTTLKGIGIGKWQGSEEDITNGGYITYLQSYWMSKGLLSDSNLQLFRPKIEYLRSVYHNGNLFKPGDRAVVKADTEDPRSTWKCEILKIFIHSFNAHQQMFFSAKWYHSLVPVGNRGTTFLFDDFTDMNLVKREPLLYLDDNVRPVEHLMHRFMASPTLRTGSDRQPTLLALEFEDFEPKTHLLRPGMPGCCPPYPQVDDVVVLKAVNWVVGNKFSLAVIRAVGDMDSADELENRVVRGNDGHEGLPEGDGENEIEKVFTGYVANHGNRTVDVSWLRVLSKGSNGDEEFAAAIQFTQCRWRHLLKVIAVSKFPVDDYEAVGDKLWPTCWKTTGLDWIRDIHLSRDDLKLANKVGFIRNNVTSKSAATVRGPGHGVR